MAPLRLYASCVHLCEVIAVALHKEFLCIVYGEC